MEPIAENKASFYVTRWLFLRLLGMVHFAALISYSVQILGLNGSTGVLPTKDLLTESSIQFAGVEKFYFSPTLAWLNCNDAFLQGMCIAGVIFSLFVISGFITPVSLMVLAALWLSVCTGGGEFTGFQSDGMLVEVSVLSLFFASWQFFEPHWKVPERFRDQRAPSLLSVWMLRFFIFRLMFASGVVKVLSGDPTWIGLTAMQYHYETQPLPTPLGWYAHQLPAWFHKLSVLGVFVSELIAPLFIFVHRYLRYIAAVFITGLHVMIILTGNYTFLNYLCIVSCVPLLDDSVTRRIIPKVILAELDTCTKSSIRPRFVRYSVNTLAALILTAQLTVLTISVLGRSLVPAIAYYLVAILSPLQIANSYGMFAVMTTQRPEIVLEGSNDGNTWLPYEFKYKVGDDLGWPPPFVAPHMPRLEWRLWFAAMGSVHESPWVLRLAQEILEGSPEVSRFFRSNPFSDKPPKFIRARVYDYHFTNIDELNKTGKWWRRENGRSYFPTLTLRNGQLEPVNAIQ